MKIGFVFTNYNNSSFTEGAIKSIQEIKNCEFQIVVVDNASDEKDVDNLKVIEEKHENLKIIFEDKNLGYFKGLNVGIRYFSKYYNSINVLVVGNNDLIFHSNFYDNLLQKKELMSIYPVIAPNIITVDGFPQNPHVIKEISKMREFIFDVYHFNYSLSKLILKLSKLTHSFTDRQDEQQFNVAQEIHQGYGACYILTPKFFEFFNELWSPTFLMYEEYFLSKQLLDKGFMTYYEPSIKLTHLMHATTDKLPGKLKWKFSKKSHKEYRKYVKVFR